MTRERFGEIVEEALAELPERFREQLVDVLFVVQLLHDLFKDPQRIKGGLNLMTREQMLVGGENSDKVLVPGNAEESDLYIAVTWEDPDLEMPPKENDRLTSEQISLVKRWIDAGAPWVDETTRAQYFAEERMREETEDGVIIKTSGGLGDEWTYRRYRPEDV